MTGAGLLLSQTLISQVSTWSFADKPLPYSRGSAGEYGLFHRPLLTAVKELT